MKYKHKNEKEKVNFSSSSWHGMAYETNWKYTVFITITLCIMCVDLFV